MKTILALVLALWVGYTYAETDVSCFMPGQQALTEHDVNMAQIHPGDTSYTFVKNNIQFFVPTQFCMVRNY